MNKEEMLKDLEEICKLTGKMEMIKKYGELELYAEKYMNKMIKYANKYNIKESTDLEDYSHFTDTEHEEYDHQYLCGGVHKVKTIKKIKELIIKGD